MFRPLARWTLLAAILALIGSSLAAAPAEAASDMTVTDVAITPTHDDLADGFGYLSLELHLLSTSGLPDSLFADGEPVVFAEPVGAPWAAPGEYRPSIVSWTLLNRVSGTPTDGVWRGTVQVSPQFGESWLVSGVRDFGTPEPEDFVDITDRGATVELGNGAPTWRAVPAPGTPVPVVTGTEIWIPRARITDRTTGAGIAGFWLDQYFDGDPAVQYPAGAYLARADRAGNIVMAPEPVIWPDRWQSRHAINVYGGRASRGFSLEAGAVLWPYVKWQADQQFAVSGRTVTATGNAFPAPVIYPAANPTIHLQQLVGRTWRTVASSYVRANGRYTITWTAPGSGPQVLRVYKPGGSELNGWRVSAGTVLAATPVAVR